MNNFAHIKLFILITFSCLLCYATIPDYIHVCKANDPQLAQCINNSVNLIRPKLKEGIAELEVPPIEPLILDKIELRRGPAAVAFRCDLTNLKVWGASDFIVTDLKVNIQKSRFDFNIILPNLYIEGDYDLDMKILLANVRGQGLIQGNFTDFSSDVMMKGTKIIRDGVEYLNFEKIRLNLAIGKTKLSLQNLFEQDSVLREISNNVVNDNSDLFIAEIKPTIETALGEKFKDIANKITLRFSYKELFP